MNRASYKYPTPCNIGYENIVDLSAKIRKKLNLRPGDELDPIIEHLNGQIIYRSIYEKNHLRDFIRVRKGGEFKLCMPCLIFPLQRRLVTALNLGHLFLHSQLGKIPITTNYDSWDREEHYAVETEARTFAYEFLAPLEELEKHDFFGGSSLSAAVHFLIPQPIALLRLKEYGRG